MKSPAFQFYPADYASSQRVRLLTLEEEGAYINLLCSCWLHGSIPADPAMAARLVGKGCSATLATTVLTMFTPSSEAGRMVHDRLERERLKQSDWREKSASGGRKSAELRKGASTTLQPPLPNGINQKATLQSSVSSLQSSSTSTSSAPTHTAPVPVAAGDEAPAADCPFPPEVAKKVKRNPSIEQIELERIYEAYPRKEKRPDAFRAIKKALMDSGMTHESLLEITQTYAKATERWPKDKRKYIPYPASWFNSESYRGDPKRWEDNAMDPTQETEFADAFDPDFQPHFHRNTTQ
jgi:uncharacterized protein YdaU (DUF1376 family)